MLLAGFCSPTRRLRALWVQDGGAVSVDAVLWLPVFIFLFALLADASLILGDQARVLRVVQDTNRAISIGRIRTSEDAEQYIRDQISDLSPNADVETVIDDAGVIHSTVVLPMSDMTATGMVNAFKDLSVTVTAQHMAEN